MHRPPTDGGTWGSDRDGDGVYSGLLGDLQARRADLGVAQLFVRRKRMGIMDFSGHYDYDYSCFMVRKPKPLPQVRAGEKNGEDFAAVSVDVTFFCCCYLQNVHRRDQQFSAPTTVYISYIRFSFDFFNSSSLPS